MSCPRSTEANFLDQGGLSRLRSGRLAHLTNRAAAAPASVSAATAPQRTATPYAAEWRSPHRRRCTGRCGVRWLPTGAAPSHRYTVSSPRPPGAVPAGARTGRHQGLVLGGAPSIHFRTHFRYDWACGSCGGAPDTGAREASRLPRFRVGGPPKGGESAHVQDVNFGRLVCLHVGKRPLRELARLR